MIALWIVGSVGIIIVGCSLAWMHDAGHKRRWW